MNHEIVAYPIRIARGTVAKYRCTLCGKEIKGSQSYYDGRWHNFHFHALCGITRGLGKPAVSTVVAAQAGAISLEAPHFPEMAGFRDAGGGVCYSFLNEPGTVGRIIAPPSPSRGG